MVVLLVPKRRQWRKLALFLTGMAATAFLLFAFVAALATHFSIKQEDADRQTANEKTLIRRSLGLKFKDREEDMTKVSSHTQLWSHPTEHPTTSADKLAAFLHKRVSWKLPEESHTESHTISKEDAKQKAFMQKQLRKYSAEPASKMEAGKQRTKESSMAESSSLVRKSRETVEVSRQQQMQTNVMADGDSKTYAEMDSTIHTHLQICNRPNSTLEHIASLVNHPYHQIVVTGLKAMETFMPKQYSPKFKNPCWFGKKPSLPTNRHDEFTEYRGCMPNVLEKYPMEEAISIVQTAITTPAHGPGKLINSLNMTQAIFPPQCNSSPLSMRECNSKYKLFCVPQILLAGFPKCATSSLYYMLARHPELARPRMKEEHIWRDYFYKEMKLPHKQLQVLYYIFHFERAAREILFNPNHITIDGSTTTAFPGLYMEMKYDEDMCIFPRMMVKMLPQPKLIFMMRNPVDRLYSDYWYLCAKFQWKEGRTVTVPADYLRNGTIIFHRNSAKMMREYKACLTDKSVFECVRIAGVGYAPEVACQGPRIGLSLYYYHIIRWFNVLPQENFLFLRTEDFLNDPQSAMHSVYKFLDLDTNVDERIKRLSYKNVNTWIKSSSYKSDFKMPPNTRKMLDEFFEPYNQLLSRLLKDEKFMWKDIDYSKKRKRR